MSALNDATEYHRVARFDESDRVSALPLMTFANEEQSRSLKSHYSSGEENDEFDVLITRSEAEVTRTPRRADRKKWCSIKCNILSPGLWFIGTSFAVVIFIALFAVLSKFEFMKSVMDLNIFAQPHEESDIGKLLIDDIDPDSISSFLRTLTLEPHMAGSKRDQDLAKYIQSHFQSHGFDKVSLVPYDVLLSSPSKTNKVFVVDTDGSIHSEFNATQFPLNSDSEASIEAFNAYSANGIVEGNLVYVNYGMKKDFDHLKAINVTLKDCIVLARYGNYFRGRVVDYAEDMGAAGLIFFSDPIDVAPAGANITYPKTYYMPSSGIKSGVITKFRGDPLTPHYPSVQGAYRIPTANASLPKIIVQPISARDAEILLNLMIDTNPSPNSWQGNLKSTYPIGPGFKENKLKVRMDISTTTYVKTITNVIAVLQGRVETDRYVILGNHRDAWGFGAADPGGGTAALMELGRVFGKMKKERGWVPRRSVMFCSWSAEEFGAIGSTEWVEQYRNLLQSQAVAYINVDEAVIGYKSLGVWSVPLLYHAMIEAAKIVKNPDSEAVENGQATVLDNWLYRDQSSNGKPTFWPLTTSSDYTAFIQNLGIPSIDFTYLNDENTYPLYHTAYDTYRSVAQFRDPNFQVHKAIAQVWAELTRILADSIIIPFNVSDYAIVISKYTRNLQRMGYESIVNLEPLKEAVDKFTTEVTRFHAEVLPSVNMKDPLAVRKINDILMNVERAFINPMGLPRMKMFNHMILTPPVNSDEYGFGGLINLIESKDHQEIEKHVSEIIFYIKCAVNVLKSPFL